MATTEQAIEALGRLTESPDKFPGLPSEKDIIEAYIKKKYPMYTQLDTAAKRKQFIDNTYKIIELEIKMYIYMVKSAYANIKSGLKQIQDTVAATIASALIPTVLPNAGGPSLPNPLSVLQTATVTVNQMLAIISGLVSQFVMLLSAAIKIELEIPDSVLLLIDTIETVRSAILAIPKA